MNTYSFSEDAIQDLNDICEYIARKNPSAAPQLFDRIRQKCKSVANFPNMGKSYESLLPNLRGVGIDDYIIFYYPRTDGIDVVRVISGRRNLESFFSQSE